MLMDGAVTRRVILGDGQAHGCTVFHGQDALHAAFAKAGGAHHDGALQVLQGAGGDFGGAGTAMVDDHRHGITARLSAIAARRAVRRRILRGNAPLGGDNDGALGQKLATHGDGAVEQPARIVAQVENKGGHALFFETVERITQITGGCLGVL